MSTPHEAITDDVRAAFARHLAQADEEGARAQVVALFEAGVPAEDLLLGLVAPAQVTIGARWAADTVSVAEEHAATHVSEQAVSALAAATRSGERRSARGDAGSIAVACADGEWHALPARLLTEVLRLRGYAVRFLGADVPASHLVSYLHQNGPDLVALSCSLPLHLPRAHQVIEVSRLADFPVLAGGPGFGPGGTWAYAVGADLYARDAREAVDLLATTWPPPLSGAPSLDAQARETYGRIVSQRPELLRHLATRLRTGLPALDVATEERQEAVLEDLGRLVDSLAAGVFVDDPRVLTGHLAFMAGFLDARSVAPGLLHTTVGALIGLLWDSPRALAHLETGQRWLESAGHSGR